MYVALTEEPTFLKLTFQLFISMFFTCSTQSVEIHENGIQKHRCLQTLSVCICNIIIVRFVLTLPLTRLPYEFFCLPYISHFVCFDNLVLIKSNDLLSCGWYLSLFLFIPVCLTIIYWYCEEKRFFGHTWGVQEQNKGTYILWTLFCH